MQFIDACNIGLPYIVKDPYETVNTHNIVGYTGSKDSFLVRS